jgi:two-component system CheB/CheR fusion protein
VQAHSFLNLDIGLPVERLFSPLSDCLAGRVSNQEIVLDAVNRRGRSIQCYVTINPLTGVGGSRQGAIVLMDDLDNMRNSYLSGVIESTLQEEISKPEADEV